MLEFILNAVFWTLALYGLWEIIKNMIYLFQYTNMKSDGIYLIVAVKNQEEKIEGFLRSILFRILYGKEEQIKDIIITDLDSQDHTEEIIEKLAKEQDCIKIATWKDCKDIIDNVNGD